MIGLVGTMLNPSTLSSLTNSINEMDVLSVMDKPMNSVSVELRVIYV